MTNKIVVRFSMHCTKPQGQYNRMIRPCRLFTAEIDNNVSIEFDLCAQTSTFPTMEHSPTFITRHTSFNAQFLYCISRSAARMTTRPLAPWHLN